LQAAEALPVLGLLVLVAAAIVFLTELTSNTATTAAFMPILAGLAIAVGQDPLYLTVVAALAASCAFMLPVATPPNAVMFGSGRIRMGEMVRAGFVCELRRIDGLPIGVHQGAQGAVALLHTELTLDDDGVRALTDAGFIPVASRPGEGTAHLPTLRSVSASGVALRGPWG
jgi:hypothetical protein